MPGRSEARTSQGASCDCEATGRNVSEPRRSPVTENGEAEPLESWRRQHRPASVDACAGLLTRGSRGSTPRRESAEHGRPHLARVATATEGQGASQGKRVGGGVGRVRSTWEGGESRWREGALLDEATTVVKKRGLWLH